MADSEENKEKESPETEAPEEKAEEKPEEKSEEKSEEKPEEKSEEKPESSPAPETRETGPAVALKEVPEEKQPPAKVENRSNFIEGFSKTVTYIKESSADKSLTFRESDKLTLKLLIWALILSAVFVILLLASVRIPSLSAFFYIMADIMLFSAILGFTLTRFGIIRAMEPRYAVVTYHLMVGTGLLGITIVFNIMVVAVMILFHDKIAMVFGG
ncbi:MAG: hypothetical protein IPM23_23300 [Candidatus Melainabacteria bacterium]|nr:hypothetical protein [Candidatus Melainabacteria bacterium]